MTGEWMVTHGARNLGKKPFTWMALKFSNIISNCKLSGEKPNWLFQRHFQSMRTSIRIIPTRS
ncbi:Uncharacterized protein APZ42_003668, partial [Daphnia magna]